MPTPLRDRETKLHAELKQLIFEHVPRGGLQGLGFRRRQVLVKLLQDIDGLVCVTASNRVLPCELEFLLVLFLHGFHAVRQAHHPCMIRQRAEKPVDLVLSQIPAIRSEVILDQFDRFGQFGLDLIVTGVVEFFTNAFSLFLVAESALHLVDQADRRIPSRLANVGPDRPPKRLDLLAPSRERFCGVGNARVLDHRFKLPILTGGGFIQVAKLAQLPGQRGLHLQKEWCECHEQDDEKQDEGSGGDHPNAR